MCSRNYIAKKTTTRTCLDICAKRFYKLEVKNSKVALVELQSAITKSPKAFVTEAQIRAINARQYLNLKKSSYITRYLSPHIAKMDIVWEDRGEQDWKEIRE